MKDAFLAISMVSRVSVRVPIWFSLIRIELAAFSLDAPFETLGIGDENVVADDLDLGPEFLGHEFPAVPVVFGVTVLDGDDRKLVHQVGVKFDHFLGSQFPIFGLENISSSCFRHRMSSRPDRART